MPIRTYKYWNRRPSDLQEQIEPFRKYCFLCEGANTETFYFKHLIGLRKQLKIHPMLDIILWEKTGTDRDISYPRNLLQFALSQKENLDFDREWDKIVLVFDGDIFEEKVKGYDELIAAIEEEGIIAAVTNPNFELFLLLHIENSFEDHIKGREKDFLKRDEKNRYSHAFKLVSKLTGLNPRKNPDIGKLADKVLLAIAQEKHLNQDIHILKGKVTSNIGAVIESIINEKPEPRKKYKSTADK